MFHLITLESVKITVIFILGTNLTLSDIDWIQTNWLEKKSFA